MNEKSINIKSYCMNSKKYEKFKNDKNWYICNRTLFLIFLGSTKLKIVCKKIRKFFKRHASIML